MVLHMLFESAQLSDLSRLARAGTEGQLCMFALPGGGYSLLFKAADVGFVLVAQRGGLRVFKTADAAISAALSAGFPALVSYLHVGCLPAGFRAFVGLADPAGHGWKDMASPVARVVLECGASGSITVDKSSSVPADHIGKTVTILAHDDHGDRVRITGKIIRVQ